MFRSWQISALLLSILLLCPLIPARYVTTPIMQPMSIPAPPSNVASDRPYDVKLPPWPVNYTDAQKAAQAQAGKDLYTKLIRFFGNLSPPRGVSTFVVPPGVYRIDKEMYLRGGKNVKIIMSNVEIITTSNNLHFSFADTFGLEIAGPLILDADPIPNSQGIIVGGDLQTYIDVQTMPGYRAPSLNSRIMGYTPDGVLQRHYQDGIQSVQNLGNDTFRIKTNGLYANSALSKSLIAKAFATGNYLTSEGNDTTRSGGINFRNMGDIYMHDIYHHSTSLVYAQDLRGNVRLDRWMGQRRNGTNKLGAGGWLLWGFDGGSLDINNSEISYNYDDLTDIGGNMGIAMAGPSSNQIYLVDRFLDVGRTFVFYDASGLNNMGNATITSVDARYDQNSIPRAVYNQFRLYARNAAACTYTDAIPSLVTMDKPITGLSKLYLAECLQSRPTSLAIRNTYFHDNLAAGVQLKGARNVTMTGNVIARVATFAVLSGFSAYWLEGGPANNVEVGNNYAIDTPYSVGVTVASITISTENTQMARSKNNDVFKNVNVHDNTIINPQLGGIFVANAVSSSITNNKVFNGATYSTVEYSPKPPYMISLQNDNAAIVSNNQLININKTIGISGAITDEHLVSINSRTIAKNIKTSGNMNADGKTNLPVGILETTSY